MAATGETYHDLRSEKWRRWFSEASPYETYLSESDPLKAGRWRAIEEKLPPLDSLRSGRLRGHHRALHVLMVSGVWCGDCVRQGPMIRQIVAASDPEVELRLVDRDQDPALRDEVRILGAMRVPVVVFLSEDFFEVGRFGDRMLQTYRRKAAIETGAACPVPTADLTEEELAREREEWADIVERMILMVRLAPRLTS